MTNKKVPDKPAENQSTAAIQGWSNKVEICVPGFVPHPNQAEVVEAKEYADGNQK